MTNENGNHNDLPLDDPAFKWAWEIYKEGDHLVNNRTTFFFAAHSFLVVAYSTFAVSRFNWKENQSIYIITMGIIVFMGIIFSLILWKLNYTLTKRRAAWLEEFTAELLTFPGRHDDQVDALTQGLAWGRERRGEVYCGRVKGWY